MKMTTYHCRRCNDIWEAPDASEVDWWNDLAQQSQKTIPQMDAIRWMRDETDLGPRDIKVIACHQARESNRCCNCGRALTKGGVVDCRWCCSLNFDFSPRRKQSRIALILRWIETPVSWLARARR